MSTRARHRPCFGRVRWTLDNRAAMSQGGAEAGRRGRRCHGQSRSIASVGGGTGSACVMARCLRAHARPAGGPSRRLGLCLPVASVSFAGCCDVSPAIGRAGSGKPAQRDTRTHRVYPRFGIRYCGKDGDKSRRAAPRLHGGVVRADQRPRAPDLLTT